MSAAAIPRRISTPPSIFTRRNTLWSGRSSRAKTGRGAISMKSSSSDPMAMPQAPESTDSMFPLLEAAQIARLDPFGKRREARAGEIVFDQGDARHGIFVVLEGSIEIIGLSNGNESVMR